MQVQVLLNALSSKFFHPKERSAFMRSVGNFAPETDFTIDQFIKSQMKIVRAVPSACNL